MVFENAGNGGVVKGALASCVRSSGHEEIGSREIRFGLEKNICGLSWGNEKGVSLEGFDINGVSFNHCDRVVGNAKEEFVIECRVDQAKEISLAMLDFQSECICHDSVPNN